ncbi:MAG: MBL fold metallo-hydrolase [Trueperaceae bacterium]|nr:MBL fold metallo-hydrolase [Trueperaceae bacterium]
MAESSRKASSGTDQHANTVPAEPVASSVWRLPLATKTLPPFDHTNSYLIVDAGLGLLVDMGGSDLATLEAALEQVGVTTLTGLLLTHSHGDHCSGAAAVQDKFEVPVYVHALERERLDRLQMLDGPVIEVDEDSSLSVGEVSLRLLHTPGHSPGHLSVYIEDNETVLVGDMVAGTGSSWVGTPEGDVGDYLRSLTRLMRLDAKHLGPGHGPVIHTPTSKLRDAHEHRLHREAQVVRALVTPKTLTELRQSIYPSLPEPTADFAERSLLAHLHKLRGEKKVVNTGDDDRGPYELTEDRAARLDSL